MRRRHYRHRDFCHLKFLTFQDNPKIANAMVYNMLISISNQIIVF